MRTKKIFAWVASLALCFSMLTACESVEEKTQTTDPAPVTAEQKELKAEETTQTTASAPAAAEQKELKAEETTQTTAPAAATNEQNDFQNDEINKLFDNNYDYKSNMVEGSECSIIYMRMYGNTASIDLRADRDCTLIAALYDEDGVKMLSSAMTKVSAGSKTAEVTFNCELTTDFPYIRAFLVDSSNYAPLARMYNEHSVVYDSEGSDKQTDEEYYKKNSKVISIEDADATNMFTEAEVIAFLKERGFDAPVKHDRSAEGKIHFDEEALPNSEARHPTYTSSYYTGSVNWYITVIGKCITAYPVNDDPFASQDFVYSESKAIISYDSDNNRFFVNEPKRSALEVRVIDRIDGSTLSSLSMEDINNL